MKLLDVIHTYDPRDTSPREPCIIAEAGVNHGGNLDTAGLLVKLAKRGGADAIKFQAYKAGSLAVKDSPSYWDLNSEPATSQYELFSRHDALWKTEYEQLARFCQDEGIDFLCTPFCLESARFLADLVPVFKIASADITCKPLIEEVASYGKPILLSTGASYPREILAALQWIDEYDVPVALNHCVLSYPCGDGDANLGRIRALKEAFPGRLIGYSDHTLPRDMSMLEAAWWMGAVVLEKHFTHDRSLQGNDHYHAMDDGDLASFKGRLHWLLTVVGDGGLGPRESERAARLHARRSLVVASYCNEGERPNLTWKRPGHGISPVHYHNVWLRRAVRGLPADTVLRWEDLG